MITPQEYAKYVWNQKQRKLEQNIIEPAVISEDTNLLQEFYKVPEAIKKLTHEQLKAFITFRFNFLQEEVTEGFIAIDKKDGDGVVDSLIDLIVVSVDTLLSMGIDFNKAWTEVFKANMNKEIGIKPGRPNPLGLPDLIKKPGWVAPCHKDNLGLIQDTLDYETTELK